MRFLTAFSRSCLLSSLAQGHTVSELGLSTGCQTHRSRAGLLALTYVVVEACVIFSYISFFCTELEDDSDTSVLNTVVKPDEFS